ncbi:MAG: pilus assembly protein PilM, partial [candidate division WOR-3 bacterium]
KEANNVMVVSVRKDIIADHIATLRKVGLEPTAISVIPFALAAAAKKFGNLKEEEVVALLDIGAEFTDIIFIRNKQLEFTRTVTTAGNSITEAMTVAIMTEEGELALSLEEAERYKRIYGIPEETNEETLPNGVKVKRLLSLQRPALERFLGEINRTIDFYKREYGIPAINRILICGGGAELKGLKEFLEENLKISVEVFDPFKNYNLYLPNYPQNIGHRLVACLGLHYDPEAVDLLPSEIKFRRYAARDLQIVGAIAIVLIPLLILINIGLEVQKAIEQGQIKKLQRELKEVEVISQEYTNLKNKVDELEAQQKLLKGIVGETEVVTPLLRFFSREVPSNIQLNSLTFTGLSKINIKGVVTGRPEYLEVDLADFMWKLENSKMVKEVNLINKTKTYLIGEEVLNFELECLLE